MSSLPFLRFIPSLHLVSKRRFTIARGRRVAIAMSGGIDSSAAAMILKDQGYDCIGVFMKNWDGSDEKGEQICPQSLDLQHMHEVCNRLSIPAVEVDFSKEYWNHVFVPHFLDAYSTGNCTPNPDVQCNRVVKFRHLKHFVKNQLGADLLATGHYARLSEHPNVNNNNNNNNNNNQKNENQNPLLLKGLDELKDQSYFLCMTRGEDLRDVLFPLGHLRKKEVKIMVQHRLAGLAVLSKAESMGICFVGKRDLPTFLSQYVSLTPGRFLDIDIESNHHKLVLGHHNGKESLTLGQRARIGGEANKRYVVSKSSERDNGDVFVSANKHHPLLMTEEIRLKTNTFSWISPPIVGEDGMELECRIRHGQQVTPCCLYIKGQEIQIRFKVPQWAVTNGQVIAIYQGDVCLGGAIVDKIE